ncbi:endo alpha-1,4 polygalactosaminidase, putative [Talaromyces stipitatus ATCC 10500]|uniref:alpha-galactosidase n=1 Tax=Talaromyces stipitatus (strain ATCC 10500 / CBS 375.48 / QM 6759 / NRRL 1006) TaxID=441959 RepID=B8MMA0_TALSN|nr:endo alpha-1,4 polygalactosaminidase, putative [Talaromyces stipitatus ATCC 10500]EED13654.1 endo alpha-1,4 polygalactosaminidase, putative [Talaromyces stipitatus ATCC 10500]
MDPLLILDLEKFQPRIMVAWPTVFGLTGYFAAVFETEDFLHNLKAAYPKTSIPDPDNPRTTTMMSDMVKIASTGQGSWSAIITTVIASIAVLASPTSGASSDSACNATTINSNTYWQPTAGTTWQIELLYKLNDTSVDVQVYDIDLFDTDADQISSLQAAGRKVICYFSAGSWENWRPDADQFNSADLGGDLDGWAGEKWLNISSDSVRKIMTARLNMASQKGCDGVDPDNVDGYSNKENALDLTQEQSIGYVNFLAKEAHSRNMAIGLKNAGDIIESVLDNMQWSVNEQCVQYGECDKYTPFTDANKPVFHIEYPKGEDVNNDKDVTDAQKKKACVFEGSEKFSTVIKNMDLDNWVQFC